VSHSSKTRIHAGLLLLLFQGEFSIDSLADHLRGEWKRVWQAESVAIEHLYADGYADEITPRKLMVRGQTIFIGCDCHVVRPRDGG
jgi:hypothetical protein